MPPVGTERRRADVPHVVGDVDRDFGGNDLVDAVQHVVRQVDPGGLEVGVQVFHGARADDRGMAGDEGDCHLDEGHPGLVGERAEGIGGELGGISWVGEVIDPGALGVSGRARPADLLALAVFA